MRMFRRSGVALRMRAIGVMGFGLLLSACTSVPTAPLESYLSTFKQARSATEEVILRARAEAQWVATTPLNQRDPARRESDLKSRIGALDAMFASLEVMDRYNTLLAGLATPGQSQASIQSDLDQFAAGLTALNQSWLNKLVERVPVYGPIIAQGIEIIDDLIRRRRFAEAVGAAAGPMGTLTKLLSDNVRDIGVITALRAELELFEIETRVDDLHQEVVAGLEGWAITAELDGDRALAAAVDRFSAAATRVHGNYGVLPLGDESRDAGAEATQPDLAAAAVWVDRQAQRAEQLADEQDRVMLRKAAFERVVSETSDLLAETGSYFVALQRAIEDSRVEATIDMGLRIMRLREALRALDVAEDSAR